MEISRNIPHNFIFWILIAIITINLAFPGEVFSQSNYCFFFVLHLLFLIWSGLMLRHRDWDSTQKAALWIGFLFIVALPGTIASINLKRTEETLWLFMSYFCLYVLVVHLDLNSRQIHRAIFFIAQMGFLISLFALYQYFFELDQLRQEIVSQHSLETEFQHALLTRVATQRIFAHFPLPNTLAGFLTMILPLQGLLVFYSLNKEEQLHSLPTELEIFKKGIGRAGWIAFLTLEITISFVVLALTKSFGGWFCLFGTMAWILWKAELHRRFKARAIGLLLLLSILGAGWLLWIGHARRIHLWDFSKPGNSVTLRLNNCRTALEIFRDFPWTGIGLGNYGAINPKYQFNSKNVTQFAHNTPLQLLSECGFPLLAGVGFLLIRRWKFSPAIKAPRSWPSQPNALQVALQGSLCAWILHNLVDINLYFTSLGSLAIFLFALVQNFNPYRQAEAIKSSFSHPVEGYSQSGWWRIPAAMMLLVFGLNFGLILRGYVSKNLMEMAGWASAKKQYPLALKYADWGVWLRSYDSEAILNKAQVLAQLEQLKNNRMEALRELKTGFQKATQMDPYNAQYQFELSKILSGLGEKEAAILATSKAKALFPSETKYQ